MKVGRTGERLVGFGEEAERWLRIGDDFDDDMLTFLAGGGEANTAAAQRVSSRSTAAPVPTGLPFAPTSLRDFSLWEKHMVDAYHVPIFVHPDEQAHAHRDAHYGLDAPGLVANLWRPKVMRWFGQALPVGVADKDGVTDSLRLPVFGQPIDVPGRPVAIPSPGHTPGHCAYYLPSTGVLVSGDALITGHLTSHVHGPQLLPAMFDHDRDTASHTLETLAQLPATTLLPGHGPAYRGAITAPVAHATAHLRTAVDTPPPCIGPR